jgi:hypothetical protein
MTAAQLFILSEEALTKIVSQIQESQWNVEVPKYISEKGGSLRTIVNYHAYDDAWVPDVLAGKTAQEVGTKYDGDLLGEKPLESWNAIVEKAIAAVKQHTDFEKKVQLSYGDFSAREYLEHIATFRTFRAIEIARFIGVDDTLPTELVQGMWEMLQPNVSFWRQVGVFGPEIKVAESENLQARLMGLAGREPHKK